MYDIGKSRLEFGTANKKQPVSCFCRVLCAEVIGET